MPLDFTKCEDCGKIFPATEPGQILCPSCRGESAELSEKDMLRNLKNTLRDVQAVGEFLRIPQLAERSKVEEEKIWHFINTGELSTASFDDPAVKEFLVRKKREQAKQATKQTTKQTSKRDSSSSRESSSKVKSSGFHLSGKNDRKK